jgi:hypothetical protein
MKTSCRNVMIGTFVPKGPARLEPAVRGEHAATEVQAVRLKGTSMDPEQVHHRSYLFTVRIWPEAVGEEIEWRGKVQHVTSGKMCFFRDWPTLVAFLEEILAASEGAEGFGE